MFKKISQIISGDKNEQKPVPSNRPATTATLKSPLLQNIQDNVNNDLEIFDPLPEVINVSGRISREYLNEIAAAFDENEFAEYMQHPVLAGAGIHEGSMSSENQASMPSKRKKTLMFIPARKILEEVRKNIEASPLNQAIFCLTKSREAFSKDPNLIKIGRENDNDLIVPDFAVSKNHAEITIENGGYYLTDIGSSNGTLVNEQKIPAQQKIVLQDGDIISFARFETTFLSPQKLYSYLKRKS